MALVRFIQDDKQFQSELASAGEKLVVADFSANWCGPCKRMGPVFEELSTEYTNAVFIKIDVDECEETAVAQGISVMPTFVFYRNKTKLDKISTSSRPALEKKIKRYYGEEEEITGGDADLTPFISKAQCVNERDDHPVAQCLQEDEGFLQSDSTGQLIISIAFNRDVKIHSLKFKAPADKGPKNVKIFINEPETLNFDLANKNMSVQDLEIAPGDLEGNPIILCLVKFQDVQNIQVFVKDNQSGGEVTQIDHFAIIGSPVNTTNTENDQESENHSSTGIVE